MEEDNRVSNLQEEVVEAYKQGRIFLTLTELDFLTLTELDFSQP